MEPKPYLKQPWLLKMKKHHLGCPNTGGEKQMCRLLCPGIWGLQSTGKHREREHGPRPWEVTIRRCQQMLVYMVLTTSRPLRTMPILILNLGAIKLCTIFRAVLRLKVPRHRKVKTACLRNQLGCDGAAIQTHTVRFQSVWPKPLCCCCLQLHFPKQSREWGK